MILPKIWAIRSRDNFEKFKEKYNYPLLDYDRLIRGLYNDEEENV